LRDNPDSVTHLLETLTGEPLTANVLQQHSTTARAGNEFEVGVGRTITQRRRAQGHRTSRSPGWIWRRQPNARSMSSRHVR
jgi:hypothetical protein